MLSLLHETGIKFILKCSKSGLLASKLSCLFTFDLIFQFLSSCVFDGFLYRSTTITLCLDSIFVSFHLGVNIGAKKNI